MLLVRVKRYQSLQHLSLSEATTLGFLGPVGTGILGYLVLKEPYTRREATAGGKSPRALNTGGLPIANAIPLISIALTHPPLIVISLIGVVLIARPTALFGSTPEISNGLPVSPDWGGEVAAGSRTSWHDKVYDPDTGAVIRRDTQAERLASVGFALLGVCGASGACEFGRSGGGLRARSKRTDMFGSILRIMKRYRCQSHRTSCKTIP